jgi:hypothetical protein
MTDLSITKTEEIATQVAENKANGNAETNQEQAAPRQISTSWSKTDDMLPIVFSRLIAAKKLQPFDQEVHAWIGWHVNGNRAYPGLDRLVKLTKKNRRTVMKAIDRLEQNGLLERKHRFGTSDVYTVIGVAKGKANPIVPPLPADLAATGALFDHDQCTFEGGPVHSSRVTSALEQEEQENKSVETHTPFLSSSNNAMGDKDHGSTKERGPAARGRRSWSDAEEAVYAALLAEWPFIPHEVRTREFIAKVLADKANGRTLAHFIQAVRQNPSLQKSVNRAGLYPQNLIATWYEAFKNHQPVYRPSGAL